MKFNKQIPTSSELFGFFGTVSALGASGLSLMQQIELWLRVTSLLIGIAVGTATFLSIVKNWRRKS